MLIRCIISLCCLYASQAFGHGTASNPDADASRTIDFPNTENHLTLVFDPHTHSVFSDGHVWPRIRIGEALRDGLDAIAITEHLEYQPHLADIPHKDRNRAYEDALAAVGEADLLVVAGSEITRSEPIGHVNAVFIDDANGLVRFGEPDDPSDIGANFARAAEWPPQEAIDAANDQGGFLFWNHGWWQQPNSIPVLPDFHRDNIRKGLLHGIEIANGATYSPESFQLALDRNLTLIGVSDVHNLIDWDYEPHLGGHRPVTLVFAEERTQESMKAALMDRRSVVWYRNLLIGREQHLMPLLEASITLDEASYVGESEVVLVTFTNKSDANFQLRNLTDYTFARQADIVELPPHETTQVGLRRARKSSRLSLEFEVMNALTAPAEHPEIEFRTQLED